MLKLSRTIPLALGLALAASGAQASDIDTQIDLVKLEIKAGKTARKDDKKDLKEIAKIRKKWDKYAEKEQFDKMGKVDEDLAEWLSEELQESRREAREAEAELVEAGGTVGGGGGGGGKPKPKGGKPKGPKEGPKASDERSDLRAARTDLRRTAEIAQDLRELQKKFDRGNAKGPALKEKSRLLAQLEAAAERDLARTEMEIAEDEQELDRLKDKR